MNRVQLHLTLDFDQEPMNLEAVRRRIGHALFYWDREVQSLDDTPGPGTYDRFPSMLVGAETRLVEEGAP